MNATEDMEDFFESLYAPLLKPYTYASLPCILLSLQILVLDSFVIKHYWKEWKQLVPLVGLIKSVFA